jgi:hypothetical protein
MRLQDTITIAEFGNFQIEATYDYRIEIPYRNKHAPRSVDDIKIEKIQLNIKRLRSKIDRKTNARTHSWEPVRTISLLDIPPWLWELLNDHEVLELLDTDTSHNELDEHDTANAADTADDRRDYSE